MNDFWFIPFEDRVQLRSSIFFDILKHNPFEFEQFAFPESGLAIYEDFCDSPDPAIAIDSLDRFPDKFRSLLSRHQEIHRQDVLVVVHAQKSVQIVQSRR